MRYAIAISPIQRGHADVALVLPQLHDRWVSSDLSLGIWVVMR